MGSKLEKVRVRRPATRGPHPGHVARAPSKRAAPSDRFRRARHHRFLVRRALGLLVALCTVALLALGTAWHGASSAGQGHPWAVSPVEAVPFPGIPGRPQPDLERVWAAATARDLWPDLATGGRLGTSGNRVALTFDDGPNPRTTPLILDALRERDVEATFFVVGRRVAQNPALLRRIVAEGHILGNHTYDHADMSGLSPDQMRRELRRTQRAVDRALGYHHPMALMRPPYGNPYIEGSSALPVFRKTVRDEGLFPVMWTVDPGDYLLDGRPQAVVRGVVGPQGAGQEGRDDEVVLLHDNQEQTAEVLPTMLDRFESSDRRVAGLDELLADKYEVP